MLLLNGTGDSNHLEGSLASSIHTVGLRNADIFPPVPTYISVGNMDLGCAGNVVHVRSRSAGDISYAL